MPEQSTLEITEETVVVAAEEHVSSDVSDEVVILNFQDDTYYGLNPVGARIWKLIQEPRRVRDVCDQLLEEYEVTPERCEQEVAELLGDLAGRGLVSIDETKEAA